MDNRRYVLNPRYRPAPLADAMVLVDDGRFSVVEGALAVPMIQHVHRTACHRAEILAAFPGWEAAGVLDALIADRVLVPASASAPADAAFWERMGLSAEVVPDRLASASVAVRRVGGAPEPRALLEALDAAGIAVKREGQLVVVLTDDLLHPDLAALNAIYALNDQSWMLLAPCSDRPLVGPIFTPHTACYACLTSRLRYHHTGQTFAGAHAPASGTGAAPPGWVASSLAMTLHAAAVEVARWFAADGHTPLTGATLRLDLRSLSTACHPLPRMPQCPVCGPAAARPSRPRILGPASHDGAPAASGFRRYTTHQILEKLAPLMSPVTGIVTDLRPADGGASDGIMFTYMARHPIAHRLDNLHKLRENAWNHSSGKGRTPEDAKAAALCEALERYCGVWRGNEFVLRGSHRALQPHALAIPELTGFSERQYDDRDAWNARLASLTTYVPERFDEDAVLEWVPAWSMVRGDFRLVPATYAFYDHPGAGNRYCYPDSNGNAAGGTMAEAVLGGLLELIERDAVALWWYNRVRRPGVDLQAFDDPYIDAFVEAFRRGARDVWMLDLTSDVGVPVRVALSRRLDRQPEDVIFGASCHPDPKQAALGALMELNQLRANVADDTADGTTAYRIDDPHARDWFAAARVDAMPYLQPLATRGAPAENPLAGCSTADAALARLVQRLAAMGHDVLVVDQTRPDVDLAVVNVSVPGFAHWWRRLGVERLYQVPVALGWRSAACAETEMNPFSIVW